MIERREILRWALGGSLLASSGALFKSLLWPAPISADENDLLHAAGENLMPPSGLPAAVLAAGVSAVARRADAERELRRVVRRGAGWLDGQAHELGGKAFAALPAAQRDAILLAASREPEGSVPRVFLDRLRIEFFRLYYSRVESLAALHLPAAPQPAGFPDYTQAP